MAKKRKLLTRWVVELERGVWIAEWSGDPGRTTNKTWAKRYATAPAAKRGLWWARRHRLFQEARVYSIQSKR